MVCFPRDLRVNLLVHHGLLVGRRIAGISPQSEGLSDQATQHPAGYWSRERTEATAILMRDTQDGLNETLKMNNPSLPRSAAWMR
jgi:hypothetical protein